ncbi:hypothetical protein RIVM261_064230 [Rivularia sp. IAM M-261]|nr:hypothetical protein CAL7716_050690 [Calothrix sp. PCC 7716]GJD21467.1 hypothetical protein RIVM261_064230 [Rivularia sp. IAM M-261]
MSFWGAAAYANGSVWEPMSDAMKRLEFWDWWLTTAIPEASAIITYTIIKSFLPINSSAF